MITRHAFDPFLRPEHRTTADTQLLAHLERQHHDVAEAMGLAQDFGAIVRQRQADRFDAWLTRVVASDVAPLRRFAMGLRADYEAVKAGLGLPWNNGPVEGHINRLKMLIRGTRYTSSQSLAFDAGLRVCEAEARVRELDG